MNIADILQKSVDKFNQEAKCGLCWRFVMGGRQDYLNLAKEPCDGECCVLVGVLKTSFRTGYRSSGEGFRERMYRDWDIEIFAGVQSRLDIQFYNEVDDTDTEGSKWAKYLYPISCCMDENNLDLCGNHDCSGSDTTIEVVSWNGEVKINYLDNNYDGWLYKATVREYYG